MINDIHLQNFRSYIDSSFEFSPGVNIIVGPNASGKTNLIESVQLISTGSSYRSSDSEMVNFKKPWLRLEARADKSNRVVKIQKQDNKSAKEFSINTKPYQRLPYAQTVPIIIFEPNHMQLLTGSPELRRSFIDEILEKSDPEFKSIKRQYQRALAQRNRLLKQHHSNRQEIFVWNIRLSELGGKIFKAREHLLEKLNKVVRKLYPKLASSQDKIDLSYKSDCQLDNYETDLLKKLDGNLETDLDRGFTSAGPHRDDLIVNINNRAASNNASRGETRSIVLALKMTESNIIETARDQKPIMILDDVFSELDGSRRLSLTKELDNSQVFITTTDADVVIEHFTQTCNIIALT